MKKAVKIIFVLSLIFLVFTVKAFAVTEDEEGKKYTIRKEGEVYILVMQGEEGAEIGRFDSVAECFDEMNNIESITFDSVTVDEPFELPKGSYKLKGNLISSSITVPKNASIIFDSLSLTFFDNAFLRIKGGSVSIISSEIIGSGGVLIRLDYSASSILKIYSGTVSGENESEIIDIKNGSVAVLGGNIKNKCGVAIKNGGELSLANSPSITGVPYSIVLDRPMYLSYDGNYYTSESALSLQYSDEFSEGTLTEIFYSASQKSLENIKLYDKSNKEYEVTYFDKCKHSSEQNFGGVYLPFSVTFYLDGKTVYEENVLSGEKASEFTPTLEDGYVFEGWYRDSKFTEAHAFDTPIYSSIKLFANTEIEPPTFSISSMEFRYDGEEHILQFDTLSHKLSGGYYSYKWYKGEDEISTLSSLSLKNVKDSGTYSCIVTYTINGKTASTFAENIKILIKPKEISAPKIASAEYTGNLIYPSIAETSIYTASITGGISAGKYPQTLTLTDPDNTKWQDTEGDNLILYFEIVKGENSWIEYPQFFDSYVGAPLKSTGVAKFGDIIFLYSQTENGVYRSDVPKSVGTYYAKAAVLESENYTGLTTSPISFSILAEEVVGIELVSLPNKCEYFAFEKIDSEGLAIKAIYNSGREEMLSVADINFIYSNDEYLQVGDTGVIAEYISQTLLIPVTVKPLEYDISELPLVDFSVIFDGSYHTLDLSDISIIGKDNIPLKYSVSGGGSDVGDYSIVISFSGESSNYTVPNTVNLKMSITALEVALIWENTSFVYDGQLKSPTAYFFDVHGVKRSVTVCTSGVNAGEDYTANALSYSQNYIYSNPTCNFSISKADYDMSSVQWSLTEATYTGDYIEVFLSGLPSGVTVSGYTDNRAINAGEYYATVSLSYDSKNYNAPKLEPYKWTINKAEYDLSTFEFSDAEYEYDGDIKYPILSGYMPTGADGFELKYEYSSGAKDVFEGKKTVIVTFSTDSKNYLTPSPIFVTVKINPKGIYILWTSDTFEYDGNTHIPSAESDLVELKISGGAINAGEYEAYAEPQDENYYIINSAFPFTIKKAENYWLEFPSISAFYESATPQPSAKSYFDDAVFLYYTDENLSQTISAFSYGKYYMVASVPESQNYLSLESSPIEFEVLQVLPISMSVEIIGETVAFKRLGNEDYTAKLIYNDGSERLIEDEITIKYENADSLRAKDTYIEFACQEFSAIVNITVKKAIYDTSGVTWSKQESEYDGTAKYTELENLPEGITVTGYHITKTSSNSVKSADFNSADTTTSNIKTVSYNTNIMPQNYKLKTASCNFVISKIYNIQASNYNTAQTDTETPINAGTYLFVPIIAYDEENYESPSLPTCEFVIARATVPLPEDKTYEYTAKEIEIEENLLYMLMEEYKIKNAGEYYVTYILNDIENCIFESGESTCTVKVTVTPIVIDVSVSDFDLYLFESDITPDYTLSSSVLSGDELGLYFYLDGDYIYLASSNPNYSLNVKAGKLNHINYPNRDVRSKIIIVFICLVMLSVFAVIIYKKADDIKDAFYMAKSKKKNRKYLGVLDNGSQSISIYNSKVSIQSNSQCDASLNYEKEDDYCSSQKAECVEEDDVFDSPYTAEVADEDHDFDSPPEAEDTEDCVSNSRFEVENAEEDNYDIDISNEDDYLKEDAYKEEKNLTDSILTEKQNQETLESYINIENTETESNKAEESEEEKVKEKTDTVSNMHSLYEPTIKIKMEEADQMLSDSLAKDMIKNEREVIYTNGKSKSIINVDTLSRNFLEDDRVDINILKKKSLIPYDTAYIKVLARGAIDKPLKVYANDFSLSAVKMILLSGGEARKVVTIAEKSKK